MLAEGQRNAPREHHHHAGAHGRGQVRVHMRHAHLGQQGSGGGKQGRKQRPSNPAHAFMLAGGTAHTRQARLENVETGRASKTALRVAIRRAAHQLADPPPVLDDPIAVRLIGPGYTRDLDRAMEKVARDFRAFMAARSRYVEDGLAEAVAEGVTQYVVLGAGLDTFAYRNPLPSLRVFEVDFPATQAWKRELLARAGIAIPESLTFVALDFEHQALADGLTGAGFKEYMVAYFGWLG